MTHARGCRYEKVTSELGNHMKLTCYEDDRKTKISIGEGSTKVVETGHAGAWVPITDDRKVGASSRPALVPLVLVGREGYTCASPPAGTPCVVLFPREGLRARLVSLCSRSPL